jgi:carboxymethylenebutenolidase
MSSETFTSGPNTYKITVYPGPADAKKHPMILLVHGNFGLVEPYGDQIHDFAKKLAQLGYLTAVPQYYDTDDPRPTDRNPDPHVPTLSAAIGKIAERADADPDRLGLVGFSLGAATVMTYIAANPSGKVRVLADFFGFLTPTIRAGLGNFPPTIIFHNQYDQIVPVWHSQELDRLLPSTIEHELVPPYEEKTQVGNHAFRPGGAADLDSREKAKDWFVRHLPPNRTEMA